MTTQHLLSDFHSGVMAVTNKLEQGLGFVPFWQEGHDYKYGDVVRGTLTDHREYVCSDTTDGSEEFSQICSASAPQDQAANAQGNPWILIAASATVGDPHAEAPVMDTQEELDLQMLDEQLLDLISATPMEEGYERYMDYIIFPMSIDEVWKNFFSDEAVYDLLDPLKAQGDKFDEITRWAPPEEGDLFRDKVNYLMRRDRIFRSHVPPNPLIDFANARNIQYLIERSDSSLTIGELGDSNGYPYADSFRVFSEWKFLSLAENQPRTILRHSYIYEWIYEPKVFKSVLKATCLGKVKSLLDIYYDEYFPHWIQDYVEDQAARAAIGNDPASEAQHEVRRLQKHFDQKLDQAVNGLSDELSSMSRYQNRLTALILFLCLTLFITCRQLIRVRKQSNALALDAVSKSKRTTIELRDEETVSIKDA